MVISVTNLKGGVGKSTISRNLAAYFASKGVKVCLVDTDIEQRTTCDWAERRADTAQYIPVFPMTSLQTLPKDVENHENDGYQLVIVDGVPQLDKVATRTILISDLLLIPITPSIDDIKSFERFLSRFEEVKAHRDSIPAYIVLNKFSGRNNEDIEMQEAINLFADYGIKQLKSTVATRVAHARSSKYGLTAFEWTEDDKAKQEINALGEELEAIVASLL
jgi:chromosome partitioning protein